MGYPMNEDTEQIIEISGLRKRYGDIVAVDDVSLTVDRGEIVGLLGPNGAGKTTMIKSMLGLIEPSDGRVIVGGSRIDVEPTAAYRHVGAMLEGARNVYWRLTVRENLRFFSQLVGVDPASQRERHDELLERFGLADKADETVNDLSRGQKQKVALACTLARDVDVIVLDEPTLGLDVGSSQTLRTEIDRLVREESLTVLLSSHDMDVIQELCDRVVVLQDGSIIADDDVADLVGLFRTQSFRIEYVGTLPDTCRTEVEIDVIDGGDRIALEGSVSDATAFYELLGHLLSGPGSVVRIETSEPDLEDAFLQLTDTEESQASEPRSPQKMVTGATR